MKKEIIYLLLFISVVGLTFWWLVKMEQIKKENSKIEIQKKQTTETYQKLKKKQKETISGDNREESTDNLVNEMTGSEIQEDFQYNTGSLEQIDIQNSEILSGKIEEIVKGNTIYLTGDKKENSSIFPKAGEIVKPEMQNKNEEETIEENVEWTIGNSTENKEESSSQFPKAGEVVKPEMQNKNEEETIEENVEWTIDNSIENKEESSSPFPKAGEVVKPELQNKSEESTTEDGSIWNNVEDWEHTLPGSGYNNTNNGENNVDKNNSWTKWEISYDTRGNKILLGSEL